MTNLNSLGNSLRICQGANNLPRCASGFSDRRCVCCRGVLHILIVNKGPRGNRGLVIILYYSGRGRPTSVFLNADHPDVGLFERQILNMPPTRGEILILELIQNEFFVCF